VNFSISPKWGIRIFAVWGLVLTILAGANLLILSETVELYSNQYNNQSRVWFIFALNIIFVLGFAGSTYGLWKKYNWGRLAFLGVIGVWSGFNFLSLFAPGLVSFVATPPLAQLLFNGLRYSAALVIPFLYLNLPHIKTEFQ